jgi:hypothetical protein
METLSNLLFGVSSLDPLTFITLPILLTVAAAIADYVPARRAKVSARVMRNAGFVTL